MSLSGAGGRALWRSAGAYAGVRPNGRPRLRSAQIAPAGKSTVGREACTQTLGQSALYDVCPRSLTSRRQRRRTDRPGSNITRCLREYEPAGVAKGAVARLSAKQPLPVVKLDPDASLPLPTWRDIAPYAEHGLQGHVRFVDSVGQLRVSKRSASIQHTWANSRFARGHRNCTRQSTDGSMRTERIVRWVPSAFSNSPKNLKRYSCPAPLVNRNAPATAREFHAATGNRAQKPKLRAFQSPFTSMGQASVRHCWRDDLTIVGCAATKTETSQAVGLEFVLGTVLSVSVFRTLLRSPRSPQTVLGSRLHLRCRRGDFRRLRSVRSTSIGAPVIYL